MKLIKKSEKLLLEKIKIMEESESENLPSDTNNLDSQEASVVNNPDLDVEDQKPRYVPWRDQPIIQSVGNSGWQVSEIWKDIRLDDFSSR